MKDRQYIVTAEVTRAAADRLATLIDGVDPVQLERPGHARVWLEWYLPQPNRARALLASLRGRRGVAGVALRPFTARDWNALWRKQVQGRPVGRRLYLAPVWEKAPASARGRLLLRLDPGLGFGTGEHFTTRFCLEKLEYLCQKIAPRSVLDVGTGSGILAVAAAKLGCPRVVGFDNDPQAVAHARRHVALNRVGARVRLAVSEAQVYGDGRRFEVVCANLFAPLLIELAPRLTEQTTRWLVLSGLREWEVDGVADVFAARGLQERARDGDGEWAGLLMMKDTKDQ